MSLLEKSLLAISVVLFCLAAYICWLNRADTALRAKIFSALLVGVAAAAAAGVFSLKAEKQEVSFSSIFVFNTKTKMPLDAHLDKRVNLLASCPNAPLIEGILTQVEKASNIKDDGRNIESGNNTYYDLLTALLIQDMLLLYSQGWDIEMTSLGSELVARCTKFHAKPCPRAKTVCRQDFVPLFDQPEFLEALLFPAGEFKIPSGTKMDLKKDPLRRTIVLKNAFATVRITIAPGWAQRGLGALSQWVKMPDGEQQEYMSAVFHVTVAAEYAYLRSGHPDMPVYKNWVKTMTEYLRSDLGSDAWEERLRPDPRDYMPEGT